MINRTKVKESTQIKPGDNGDVLVMKDNAPEWSTPSDAGLAEQANVDLELSKKQDKLVAGDNIHIDGNTISADGKPTPINIGTVISGEVPMVSNSGTDTDVVLNFVLPKGDKGDPGKDGTQVNSIAPLMVETAPTTHDDTCVGIGHEATANGESSTAVGYLAQANANNSVAIGRGSVASGNGGGVAVGYGAEANGYGSVAVGSSIRSTEYGAVVIGSNARAESSYGIVLGFGSSANDMRGIAIGDAATAGEDAISLGYGADSSNQGIAIGRASNATDEKSVAIGSFSFTSAPNTVSFGNGDAGSDPATRRLVNVTDPTDPQDAATKNYVDTKIAEIPTGTEVNNISPLQVSSPPKSFNGPTSTAVGYNSTCYFGVAIGANSTATGNTEAVAVGYQANAISGVAIGYNAEVSNSGGNEPSSVAIGGYSIANGENGVVSFGSGVSAVALSDDMSEDEIAVAQARAAAVTRRLINVTDPRDAQDAATKNYVDTQLTPINAKLQYVPENTNQILSQIQTNVEKAQSAADAKVASITAGTGISVDASNPTAPVVSTTGLATQADLTALQTTVTQQAETIAQLQATVTQLQSQLNNLTLETEEI